MTFRASPHKTPVHAADEPAREIPPVKIICRDGVMLKTPEYVQAPAHGEDRWYISKRKTEPRG